MQQQTPLDLNPYEQPIQQFSEMRRSVLHIGIAYRIKQVKDATYHAFISKMHGDNKLIQNGNETNQAEVQPDHPMVDDSRQQNQQETTSAQGQEDSQRIDSGELDKVLMLLQAQQVLANQNGQINNENQPNLNEMLSKSLHGQIEHNVQRILQNPDSATPED
jgi:hypothetical protein